VRRRLLSYLTAACINLSIVSGTLAPSLVVRPPIVRVRENALRHGRFDRRELLDDDRIAVRTVRATSSAFSVN
jgi:hypothetical protein